MERVLCAGGQSGVNDRLDMTLLVRTSSNSTFDQFIVTLGEVPCLYQHPGSESCTVEFLGRFSAFCDSRASGDLGQEWFEDALHGGGCRMADSVKGL
ncbi:hypothetical protein ABT187_47515 [Streptomyces sp. NPDC001817]|uniref:hypothetical protein n=1 Tax=Streptomyces sp. NPDC001817 TaxID=3154398 RepID=UPI00332DA2C5